LLIRTISDNKLEVKRLGTNRPITLNKTLTIDDIDIPDLTING
jgi:hypothetical protein